MKSKLNIIVFVLSVFLQYGISQSISFINPEKINVCQESVFKVIIVNSDTIDMEDIEVEVSFPCMIKYVAGSILGAEEQNIDNPERPLFKVKKLTTNQEVELTFTLRFPCDIKSCIDNGEILKNTLKLKYNEDEFMSVESPAYVVETPLLVFTSIVNPVIKGYKKQTVYRKIKVKNTKLGSVKSFVFSDKHDEGIEISSDFGKVITNDDSIISIKFDKTQFHQIGDGDELFEYNEELIINEKILITTCIYELLNVVSEISINWGCQATVCDSFSQNTLVEIQVDREPGPILKFYPILNEPTCYCGNNIVEQGLKIQNFSSIHDAINVKIDITQLYNRGYIIGDSVKIVSTKIDFTKDSLFLPIISKDFKKQTCSEVSTYKKIFFEIPLIETRSGSIVTWKTIFCSEDSCKDESNSWSYHYFYIKDCALPIDRYVNRLFPIVVNSQKNLIKTELPEIESFKEGEIQDVEFTINSPLFNSEKGRVYVEIQLPCGMSIVNPDWKLKGILPDSVKTEYSDSTTLISLEYTTPFYFDEGIITLPLKYNNNQKCFPDGYPSLDSIVTSCLEDGINTELNQCNSDFTGFKIQTETIFVYDSICSSECSPSSCEDKTYVFEYPNPEYCIDTIRGYLDYEFDVFRTTLGLPDNNNDHKPDVSGTLNTKKIRLDRAVIGDTVRMQTKGKVVIDINDFSYSRCFIEMKIGYTPYYSNLPRIQEFKNIVDPETGFINFNNSLRIFDSKTNKTYLINNITPTIKPFYRKDTLYYIFDINKAFFDKHKTAIPSGFLFESNDSIVLNSEFVLNSNSYQGQNDYNLRFQKLFIESRSFLLNAADTMSEDLFICGNHSTYLETGNVSTFSLFRPFEKGLCKYFEGEIKSDHFYGSIRNFFPFEFRQTALIKSIWYPEIKGLNFEGVEIKEAKINGSHITDPPILSYTMYQQDTDNSYGDDILGFYKYDFDSIQRLTWDDNGWLNLKAVYTNNFEGCDFIKDYKYTALVDVVFLSSNANYRKKFTNVIHRSSHITYPDLHIDVPLSNATSLDDTISWDFLFINGRYCPINSNYADAPNVFIQVENTTNKLKEFKLINIKTGKEYIPENGIYQFNTLLSCDTIPLRLTAINHSCAIEEVTFRYGWSCEPFIDPFGQTPCFENIVKCTAKSPPGVLEIDPDQDELLAELCDTMTWSEIEIFDAGLGAAFNTKVEIQLPPGLLLKPGSVQVAYPTEKENYFNISDPISLGNGTYMWDISELLDTLLKNGLPGVSFIPDNSLSLRFKTITNCDFISGSFITYSTSAEKVCGELTNSPAKQSKAIKIKGANTSYAADISASVGNNSGCSDSLAVSLNINYSEPTSQNAHIVVPLPSGVIYKPNSCFSNLSNCIPKIDSNLLIWNVDPGLLNVNLNFSISGFASLKCKSVIIPVYCTISEIAHCTSTGNDCDIKVLTGSQTILVSIERPVLRIESFTINQDKTDKSNFNFTSKLHNVGVLSDKLINIKLYEDNDGDGYLSNGDIFIKQFYFDKQIESGEFEILKFSIPQSTKIDLCHLMLVIDEKDNCVCLKNSLLLQTPIMFYGYEIDTICSGSVVELGLEKEEDNQYFWEDQQGISCSDCSMTTFSMENTGYSPQKYKIVLLVKNKEGCILGYEYIVIVLPKLRILSAPESICEGESAILFASQGKSYHWEGDGIDDATEQIQTIFPLKTDVYRVTITSQYGCTETDSVVVGVNQKPVADAGEDISICSANSGYLNAVKSEGVKYLWSPGYPYIDNPTVPNPRILTRKNTVFTLTVNDENCSETDQVKVSFYDEIAINYKGDSAKCFGDTFNIYLQGAEKYQWLPYFPEMCKNTNCDTVSFVPDSITSFEVIGISKEGCIDTETIKLNIIEDQILIMDSLTICEGSYVDIFGIERSESGLYCDTTFFGGGCMEINCVKLSVKDTVLDYETIKICKGESILFNGQELTETGTYCEDFLSATGCDSTFCITLEVFDLPSITFDIESTTINEGESTQISIVENYSNYSWTSEQQKDCDDCQSILATPDKSSIYYVEVIDENGCANNDSISIDVIPVCGQKDILIPDAFTPDINGKNDIFRIVNLKEDISTVHISVFNRWGEQVFSEQGNIGWDGKYKGENAPAEIYIYVITIGCSSGENMVFKGDLTLIR